MCGLGNKMQLDTIVFLTIIRNTPFRWLEGVAHTAKSKGNRTYTLNHPIHSVYRW